MLEMVIDMRPVALGAGLAVRRILPFRKRRMVGPFIFLDHAGPVDLPPERLREADVRPHPHIGLATVSYLFDGSITHRDSTGATQVIRPHEVNWMTAGSGISHSERFEDPALRQGAVELIQSWCALPAEEEERAPGFAHYGAGTLPTAEEGGVQLRLIAGDAYGLRSPVPALSPLFYLHAILQPGTRLALPAGHAERAVYVAKGRVALDGRPYRAGQMLVFGAGDAPAVVALEPATLMLLGGEPLGERFIWWNFVSSRKERIEQAKEDWRQGRIRLPPGDDREFVPLPDPPRATTPHPQPLS